MKKLLLLSLIFATFFMVSCNKKYIKGTKIEETPDSKEILTVFAHYISGFKKQDPDLFIPYISESYYDTNGTDDPKDDVDYDKIVEILRSDAFKELKKLNITCIVKDLQFEESEKQRAKIIFFFEVRFKMKSKLPQDEKAGTFVEPDDLINQKISDNNQMRFIKEEGKWRIISGL